VKQQQDSLTMMSWEACLAMLKRAHQRMLTINDRNWRCNLVGGLFFCVIHRSTNNIACWQQRNLEVQHIYFIVSGIFLVYPLKKTVYQSPICLYNW